MSELSSFIDGEDFILNGIRTPLRDIRTASGKKNLNFKIFGSIFLVLALSSLYDFPAMVFGLPHVASPEDLPLVVLADIILMIIFGAPAWFWGGTLEVQAVGGITKKRMGMGQAQSVAKKLREVSAAAREAYAAKKPA